MQIQQMRAFIIRTVYYLLWAAILLALLKWVLPAAAPFVIGFGLAALLRPVVRLFGRYCAANEKALAVFVMVLFYLTIGLAAVLLALRCALWVQQALVYLPDFYDQALRPGLEQLRQAVQRLADRLTPMLAPFVSDAGRQLSDSLQRVVSSLSDRAMDSLAGMAGGVPGFLLESGLCILSSFFFAADYPAVTRFLLGRMPPHWRQTALEAKKKSMSTLLRMGRAYLLLLFITWGEVWLGLALLRAPHPFGMAVITAVVDLLPVLGSGAVLVPWGIGQLLLGRYPLGFGILALYGAITVLREIIEPKLVGGQLGLHPLAALASMFIGGKVLGFWGLFAGPLLVTILLQLSGRRFSGAAQSENK